MVAEDCAKALLPRMTKLSPQQQKIVDYLADGEWRCFATPDFFIKDDRKRISELNAMGYVIEGMKCDGRCDVKHSSNVFMRRLVERPRKKVQHVAQQPDGSVRVTYQYQV